MSPSIIASFIAIVGTMWGGTGACKVQLEDRIIFYVSAMVAAHSHVVEPIYDSGCGK